VKNSSVFKKGDLQPVTLFLDFFYQAHGFQSGPPGRNDRAISDFCLQTGPKWALVEDSPEGWLKGRVMR
jgi:hypothetical protein